MAGLYDLMLMLDPNAPEERQSQIVDQARSMIESSGTLVGAHDWGTRRMAFEIDHRPDAAYRLFQFEGGNELLEQLGHTLRITDGVLRFRVIKLKPGSPPPPTPRAEPPRPRADETDDRTVAPRSAADQPAAGQDQPAPAQAEAPAQPEPAPAPDEPAPAPAEAPAQS